MDTVNTHEREETRKALSHTQESHTAVSIERDTCFNALQEGLVPPRGRIFRKQSFPRNAGPAIRDFSP